MPLPYQLKPFPYGSHDRILKILAREGRPLRILEVGTAAGYLGQILREGGHTLVGVELDREAAEQARPSYEQMCVGNLETIEFPWRKEFDWIVFADVLEHLRNPVEVLTRSIPCLKPSGKILISVPNVANLVVRLGLLMGRFNYADRGILDRTHLRFFTRRSLEEMLHRSGLRTLEVYATPVPVQLVFPATEAKIFAPLHQLHYGIVRLRQQLFGYQFVVTAEARNS
jgi:2-polyprenyl-3-methyl-5-hydroxy-6-metoxy-1,4-benzoquinol methylase